MRRAAEVSSFNLMYTLCMYYEKQKSYDKTELTFQPTLVVKNQKEVSCNTNISIVKKEEIVSRSWGHLGGLVAPSKRVRKKRLAQGRDRTCSKTLSTGGIETSDSEDMDSVRKFIKWVACLTNRHILFAIMLP